MKVYSYIKLMRPHHYIKNFLIFLPIIFSKNIFNLQLLKNTILGTISFSLMASIIYIINDIMDVEIDKKIKNRPIASGEVSVKNAYILAIVLFIINIGMNLYIKSTIMANIIFYTYFVLNILYSIKLKHIPIVDIVILASGFLIRVLYGSVITGIELSNWLYLTILSFSFYMGLGKRRNELNRASDKGREVLKYYNKSFLNNSMYMCMALGIVFYSLWCIDIEKNVASTIFNIIWSIPIVMIICMKYSLNIEGDSSGDPVDVILSDKILLSLIFFYAISMFAIIYL